MKGKSINVISFKFILEALVVISDSGDDRQTYASGCVYIDGV